MRLIFALLRIKILWCPLFLLAKQKMPRRCFCFFFLALNLIRLNVCAIRQLIPNSDMTANNATNAVCFLCVAQRAPLNFLKMQPSPFAGMFLILITGLLAGLTFKPGGRISPFPLEVNWNCVHWQRMVCFICCSESNSLILFSFEILHLVIS